jgi:hypothetical protein
MNFNDFIPRFFRTFGSCFIQKKVKVFNNKIKWICDGSGFKQHDERK